MVQEEQYSRAAHGFVKAAKMHRMVCDRLVNKVGMHRNQHKILMMLSCQKAKPSQKELADRLEISTAAVAVIIKKLEQSGYITKNSAKKDGRFNEIEITEKGREVVEETREYFSACDQLLFAGFTKEELETVETYFKRISDNLKKEMEEKH